MREITIKISEVEVLRELAKYSYTIGENIGDDNSKGRHFIQGATDPGHRDLLVSRMDDAWAEVLRKLSAFTVRDTRFPCGAQEACCCTNFGAESSEESSNTDEVARWEVVLYFPNNTYPDLGRELVRLIHRYLVLCARAEWEGLTRQDPSNSEVAAGNNLNRIKITANLRTTNHRLKSYGG